MKKKGISEVKVLKSAAGFYIGRTYTDNHGIISPYDRISGYFATFEEAEKALPFHENGRASL